MYINARNILAKKGLYKYVAFERTFGTTYVVGSQTFTVRYLGLIFKLMINITFDLYPSSGLELRSPLINGYQ